MTEQELMDAIIAFNNDTDVQRLQNLYNSSTFPDILAVGRRELSHSAFLAWLFNMSANHGLGAMPVLQLLELFVRCSREQDKNLDNNLMNAILSRSITINKTTVKTETSIDNGRPDIVIDLMVDLGIPKADITQLCIVIENKVYARENKKQTKAYFDYYKKEERQEKHILYIYLTPLLHEKGADCEAFVHITYQDLLNNVFEPILLLPDLSERTHFILNEYINCLGIPLDEFDNAKSKIKRNTIMAISNNERKLLEAFWEKHRKLIMAVLTEITTDPGSDEDTQKKVKELMEQIGNKDYSKYSINGEGSYGKGPLVRRVIEVYLENHPDSTIEDLQEAFPHKLQGQGLGVVQPKSVAIRKTNEYYELPHPESKEPIYVSKRWRGGEKNNNFDKFIKHIKDNIPEITVTQISH